MKRGGPLKRKTPLARGGGLKRGGRLNPIGKRRKREAPGYARAVLDHLTQFPSCQIGPRFAAAGVVVRCNVKATHCHHVRGRAGNYLCDRRYFLSSCDGECHPWGVHQAHTAKAYELGLLEKMR